jgi:hypothetical protein
LKVLLKSLEEKIDHAVSGYTISMYRSGGGISAVWERKEMTLEQIMEHIKGVK